MKRANHHRCRGVAYHVYVMAVVAAVVVVVAAMMVVVAAMVVVAVERLTPCPRDQEGYHV